MIRDRGRRREESNERERKGDGLKTENGGGKIVMRGPEGRRD